MAATRERVHPNQKAVSSSGIAGVGGSGPVELVVSCCWRVGPYRSVAMSVLGVQKAQVLRHYPCVSD